MKQPYSVSKSTSSIFSMIGTKNSRGGGKFALRTKLISGRNQNLCFPLISKHWPFIRYLSIFTIWHLLTFICHILTFIFHVLNIYTVFNSQVKFILKSTLKYFLKEIMGWLSFSLNWNWTKCFHLLTSFKGCILGLYIHGGMGRTL